MAPRIRYGPGIYIHEDLDLASRRRMDRHQNNREEHEEPERESPSQPTGHHTEPAEKQEEPVEKMTRSSLTLPIGFPTRPETTSEAWLSRPPSWSASPPAVRPAASNPPPDARNPRPVSKRELIEDDPASAFLSYRIRMQSMGTGMPPVEGWDPEGKVPGEETDSGGPQNPRRQGPTDLAFPLGVRVGTSLQEGQSAGAPVPTGARPTAQVSSSSLKEPSGSEQTEGGSQTDAQEKTAGGLDLYERMRQRAELLELD
ncbi:MAG: hypothetical protein JW797_15400 [Bradymonadales bacterium]|nr:hypothetical protein [Bradymonadales bacterium]